MKKLIPLLILLFISTLSVSAQSRKGKKKQRPSKTEMDSSKSNAENKSSRSKAIDGNLSNNPRADRTFAITHETGFKTIAGWGLNGTYYVQPKIAIDLGLGLGVQTFKGGIRGRYLFLDKKFTPYVGAGIFLNPIALEEFPIPDADGFEILIDVKSSTFAQFVVGAEYVGTKGFTIGFNFGFAPSLSGDNWSSNDSLSTDDMIIPDVLYNSSGVIGFNIGWAF